jgi:hypothetical protein
MAVIRQDVADMLRAGHSDRAIAKALGVDAVMTVRPARAALGLPKTRSGPKSAETLEALFYARTAPVEGGGGHLRWIGHVGANGVAVLRWQGVRYTAYRAAFEIHNGRPAQGKALPACGTPQCVAPGHVFDQPQRDEAAADAARRTLPDDAVDAMLRAGHSQTETARALGVGVARVRAARVRLGIPLHRPGPAPETVEDAFNRIAVPTDDGHLIWPNDRYRINTIAGSSTSALRYAFERKHGRPPVGKALPGCGTPRCVLPEHVEDQPMRDQYAAIFGAA